MNVSYKRLALSASFFSDVTIGKYKFGKIIWQTWTRRAKTKILIQKFSDKICSKVTSKTRCVLLLISWYRDSFPFGVSWCRSGDMRFINYIYLRYIKHSFSFIIKFFSPKRRTSGFDNKYSQEISEDTSGILN